MSSRLIPKYRQILNFCSISFFVAFNFTFIQAQNLEQERQTNFKINFNNAFQSNSGQLDKGVLFRWSNGSSTISFLKDRVSFCLKREVINEHLSDNSTDDKLLGLNIAKSPEKNEYLVWEIYFEGSKHCIPKGEISTPSVYRYFGKGFPSGKKINMFQKIVYPELYNNVDLVFYLDSQQRIKYDFILRPQAILSDIKLRYNGIKGLQIKPNGDLSVNTLWGDFSEMKPYSYFENEPPNETTHVKYVLLNSETLGFYSMQETDPSKTLVIDPLLLDWSTFFYGGGGAFGAAHLLFGMETDEKLDIYFSGITTDNRSPVIPGYYDTSFNGGQYDAIYGKMNANGDSLIFFNYLGGSDIDDMFAFALTPDNEGIIVGRTKSRDFPITKNAFDTISGGSFVTKFNAKGDSLLFSSYFGHMDENSISAVALGNSGEIIIAGITKQNGIPVSSNAFQKSLVGGIIDGFVAGLKSDGSGIIFCTYVGGSAPDYIYGIGLGKKNEIYLVGQTESSDFPNTGTFYAFNKSVKGTADAFLTKLDSKGEKLSYSYLLGGTGDDAFASIYVGGEKEDVYIAGMSSSNDFPVSSNAYQKTNSGNYDNVVLKFPKGGSAFVYSTYLGGSNTEKAGGYLNNIKVISNVRNEAIICGSTQSKNFPVTGDALQTQNVGKSRYSSKVFISKLSAYGNQLAYSTYFGGITNELIYSLCLRRVSCITHIIVGGITGSADFPITNGSYLTTPPKNGNTWAFIAKFSDSLKADKPNFGARTKTICNAFLEILDGLSEGSNRRWSTGDSGRYLFIDKPGIYWVQATYGCDTIRDSITILNPSVKADFVMSDSAMCYNGNSFLFRETSTYKNDKRYQSMWHFQDSTSIQDSIVRKSFKQAGTYSIKLISENNSGCKDSIIKKIKVYNKSKVSFNINDSSQCLNGNSFDFINTSFNPEDSLTFEWDFTDLNSSQRHYINKHYIQPGNYNIKLVAFTDKSCVDTLSKSITVLPSPFADFTWGKTCNRSKTRLTFSGSTPKAPVTTKFLWNFPDNDTSNVLNPSILLGLSGKNKVNLILKSDNGCMDQTIKEIDVKQQALANFETTDICEDSVARFTNTSIDGISYNWKFGDGMNSNLESPNHNYLIRGITQTFNVTLVANVPNGCSDSITKAITVNANSNSDFIFNIVGNLVSFKAIDTNEIQYNWSFGNGTTISTTEPNTSHTYSKFLPSKYTVCLKVINISNCLSETCKDINLTANLSKLTKTNEIIIYPNPNNGIFNIDIAQPNQEILIEIYNQIGQRIYRQEIIRSHNFNLNLADGFYLIRATKGESYQIQRMTIQK
jgi:hypothetical protein